MIGQTVSHYRILEKLGAGGMGVVYRAEDTRLGRSVALKALAPEFARDPGRRKRFQQEARAAASLTHPGIAAVYELEEVGEDLYIVYEYVRGQNLRALVGRAALPPAELLDIAIDVAGTLAAAHAHGIVHRDIKPENIMRTPEGSTKILDFGLARFQPASLDSETRSAGLTDAGGIVGTVAYMSPEQLEAREVDFRTDIFSFGVLLYELATGVRPFEGASPASTISRILTAEPVPMLQRNPVTPPELDRIVRKCLRKRREERYQSTRDLLVDLENLRRDTSTVGRPAVAHLPEEAEASLLGSAITRFHFTPRRWWEANQLVYVIFNAVLIYIGWKVKEWVGGTWGVALFLGVVVCAAASTSLRVILLGTAAVTPLNLFAEVRRVGPWARAVDLTFVGLLPILAGSIVAFHPGVAALLVGMAVAGLVAFLLIDPTLARAAFPQIRSPEKPADALAAARRDCRLLAAVQVLYLVPIAVLATVRSPMVEEVAGAVSRGPRSLGFLSAAGLSLGILVVGGVSAMGMWRGDRKTIQAFYRWFPLYFLADLLGMLALFALAVKYIHFGAFWLALPVLVYLPFHQRRLAKKLVATFPEVAPPQPRAPGRLWRPRWPWLLAAAVPVGVSVLVALNLGGFRERLLGKPAPPRIESLAVLPLENLSRDPEQDYFADGMTEALIADLAQVSALRVISRTSVMRYKGARKPLPEIAQELKVDAVVEGSVQRAGDRVKITAQLIHAPTDKHLWAKSYERDLRDVLALQSEVARAVASEIKVKLTPQEQARLATARPVNPAAHEAFLKGRYYWNKRTGEGTKKGMEYFQQAIEKDPNYALAYTGLADSYLLRGIEGALTGDLPPQEAFPKARAAAMKALEIDDMLAEAQTSLAHVKVVYDWDWLGAEAGYRRALELNPNYATTHHWYGLYLADRGQLEEALGEMKRAQELDPLSLVINANLGYLYFWARQYDQAIEQCRKTLEMDPNFPLAHHRLGLAYEQRAMYAEAIAELQKAVTLSGGHPLAIASLGHAYAVSSQRGEATKTVSELKELSRRRYVSPYAIALIYTGLGEKDRAFDWLEKAYEERADGLVLLRVDPRLDSLRDDSRFRDLMRRMKFPE